MTYSKGYSTEYCIPPCMFEVTGNAKATVAAVGTGEQEELFLVKDALSGRRYLVDSGF